VSGCSGIDMTDCLRTSRRVGLRSKGRREDECGEQNAGQMAMAAHWGKDTVQRRQSTSQTSWGTMIAGPAGQEPIGSAGRFDPATLIESRSSL
jgi:hypothetical protein